MTTLQGNEHSASAVDLMSRHGYRLARDSQERGVRDVTFWRDAAIISLVAIGSLTTNPTITFSLHITTGPTNPVISGSAHEDGLFTYDDAEAGDFLALMDAMMERRPDLVTPADEEQLKRIADLVANVKV